MSDEKQTGTTVNNTTQTATPDPSMVEQNKLDLELRKGNQQGLADIQSSGLNLGNLLLKGLGLPGYLNKLPGGIDEDTTQGLVDQSLRDIQPMFQNSGLIDSGTRASISARTANDTRLNSAQFNIQNLSQLLNLALGGQAQVQAPQITQAGMLGQRLAGLSSVNTSGVNTQTQIGMNPFRKSFAQAGGQFLGGGAYGMGMGG